MQNEKTARTVRLEPSVTEEWLRQVISREVSPNEFAEWLLSTVDLEAWLVRFQRHGGSTAHRGDDNAGPQQLTSEQGTRQPSRSKGRGASKPASEGDGRWSKETFFDFLEVVSSIEDLEWSVALLNAYLKLGPMPSSRELQDLCGFTDDHAWQQELRIAKQRLTIQARKMGAPPLFPRAKSTSEGTRMHPMEPTLFPWLKEWVAVRTEGDLGIEGGGLPRPERWGPMIEESNKYSVEAGG